jgi:hypothetical protein
MEESAVLGVPTADSISFPGGLTGLVIMLTRRLGGTQ